MVCITSTTRGFGVQKHLLGPGETDSTLLEVVDAVVAAEEGIAENGERTNGLRHVEGSKGRDAAATKLQDVVASGQGVVGAGQGKGDIGERVALRAVNGVLATEALLGANLGVEELGKVGGKSVQGRAGIQDDTSVLELSNLVAESNGVKVDLPVSLAAERNVLNLARVVILVNTAKNGLAALILLTKVKGKDSLVNELLVDHLVEGRDHLVDGDGVIAKTQNTVEATESKSQARLVSGLGKVGVLDLEVTNGDNVVGDEASQAARAVVDLKIAAVLLVSGRRGRVICGVKEASNAAARLRRNPEVGGTSVEDNLEGLGRSTDLDLGEVYGAVKIDPNLCSFDNYLH